MKSPEDFLKLLNYAKPIIYGIKSVPFGIKHLRFHSNPKANRRRYVSFSIPKKAGGIRTIHAPNKGLKSVLKCLNMILQCVYEPHKAATGFVLDKSIVTNAKQHTGSLYVYNIDLKDFFPSVDQARFWGRLKYHPFNLNEENNRLDIANIIGGLCFQEMEVERIEENGNWVKVVKNVLPQGAPTSPTITNIICERLDFYLSAVARRFGLKYSRYADDITFSSMHNVYHKDGDFIKELHRIIATQGFHIKESKVRLQRPGYRQEVTGLIVNEKVNVTKRYIKRLRMCLYLWEHYGYIKAEQIFIKDYIGDKGHLIKSKPNMANVIWGKLEYLKMVKGTKDKVYLGLSSRFSKLTETNVPAKETTDFKEVEKANIPDTVSKIGDPQKAEWITPEEYGKVLTLIKAEEAVKMEYQKSFEQVYNLTEGNYQYFKKSGELIATMNIEILDQRLVVNKFQLSDLEGLPDSVKTAQNFEERLNSQVLCPNRGLINNKAIVELAILENFGNAFAGIFRKIEEPANPTNSKIKVLIIHTDKRTDTLRKDITLRKGTLVPYEGELENSVESSLSQQHNPLNTLNVLKLFHDNNSYLKYTTHSWEFGIDESDDNYYNYRNYSDFIGKALGQWNKIKRKYKKWNAVDKKFDYTIPPSLWEKIELFLLSTDFKRLGKDGHLAKPVGWGKHHVQFGWSSIELSEWAKSNPNENPLKFPLPTEKQLEINGRKLYSFKDITILFKSEIEFREDTNHFYNLILRLWEDVWHFDIKLNSEELEKLKGVSLFTETQRIESGLNKIFESFIQGGRTTFNEAIIQRSDILIDPYTNPYQEIRITQVGSFSVRNPKDSNLDGNSGDFVDIKRLFNSLCDWSVESKFGDGKAYRLSYLDIANGPFIEEIDVSSVRGFTHVLKFYL